MCYSLLVPFSERPWRVGGNSIALGLTSCNQGFASKIAFGRVHPAGVRTASVCSQSCQVVGPEYEFANSNPEVVTRRLPGTASTHRQIQALPSHDCGRYAIRDYVVGAMHQDLECKFGSLQALPPYGSVAWVPLSSAQGTLVVIDYRC